MLGAKEELQARGFVVNATVSRQFRDAVAIVKQKKAAGLLRKKVIIHLGTNGILIDPADCDTIVQVAGPNRLVYLVTITVPKPYRDTQNARLRSCADRHATAFLLDWYGYSRGHPSWFASDGYHLTALGQVKYAGYLDVKTS
jgi:lysophospholipase L1-like esterase